MTGKKDPRFARARKQLVLAEKQWDQAAVAWWEPTDASGCVSNCFYSFENAIVACAIALRIRWTKNHLHKAQIAEQLAQQGHVTQDVSDLLGSLNEIRKDISYGEPGPDLSAIDLEDLLSELETYIADVKQTIDKLE